MSVSSIEKKKRLFTFSIMGTSATWLLGVFLSIIGSTLSNTGLNVQKYSFLKQAKLPEEMRLEYYKQWRWIVGICLVILGAIGDFTALTFAPQSVIMPVGAFTLVCNVVLAHFWLKERITKMDLMVYFTRMNGRAHDFL